MRIRALWNLRNMSQLILNNNELPESILSKKDPLHVDHEIQVEETSTMSEQISGHSNNLLLKYRLNEADLVLKPVQKHPYGLREIELYRKVFNSAEGDGDSNVNILRSVMPRFHGVARVKGQLYMMLDDIIKGFAKPCLVDVKIGRRTWDSDATPEKAEHERKKYPGTKIPLGFSVTGMQYYSIESGELKKFRKELGKSLTKDTVPKAFADFLQGGPQRQRYLAKNCLAQLLRIQEFFQTQRQFLFYASSLLIAYDGAKIPREDSEIVPEFKNIGEGDGKQGQNGPVRVYMIDFAHSYFTSDQKELDHNYIHGLENFIRIFQQFVRVPILV